MDKTKKIPLILGLILIIGGMVYGISGVGDGWNGFAAILFATILGVVGFIFIFIYFYDYFTTSKKDKNTDK